MAIAIAWMSSKNLINITSSNRIGPIEPKHFDMDALNDY